MAERRAPPTEAELEGALRALAPEVAFPPTPALVAAVRARIERGASAVEPTQAGDAVLPRGPALADGPAALEAESGLATPGAGTAGGPVRLYVGGAVRWRRLLLAAAAVLLMVTGLLAYSPRARTAVAERLGLRGVEVLHVPFLPPPAPAAPATPSAPPGLQLGLGQPVSLETVLGLSSLRIARPTLAGFDTPEAVYLSEGPAGSLVTFAYAPRPDLPPTSVEGVGLLLTQFRGDLVPEFAGKMLGPGTTLVELRVGGGRALWVAGSPHILLYRDARGNVRDDSLRLAGNTLLWEREGVLLRIESALDQAQAVRIAESTR